MMATVARGDGDDGKGKCDGNKVAADKEGNGKSGKGNSFGNDDGG